MERVNTRAEDVIQALRNEAPCRGCGTLVQALEVTDIAEDGPYCGECLWHMQQMYMEESAEEHRQAEERRRQRDEEEATR